MRLLIITKTFLQLFSYTIVTTIFPLTLNSLRSKLFMDQYGSPLRNGLRKHKSDPSAPFFSRLAYHDHLFLYRF